MKRNNLKQLFRWGIVYFCLGIVCLLAACFSDTRLDSLLCGFAGSGIISGLYMIFKSFYWNAPKRQARYAEKLEQESIELHDELKTQLRDKAGRYTYAIGLCIISFSMVGFAILGSFGILADANIIIAYLGIYFALQVILGSVIFRKLMKKYSA